MPDNTIDIEKLVARRRTYKFYGANCNQFKLDKKVYEVEEDECDGYRSCMGELRVVIGKPTGIFYGRHIAKVKLRKCDNEMYEVVDVKDLHVWLTFGTSREWDYYPSFIFDMHPKPTGIVQLSPAPKKGEPDA